MRSTANIKSHPLHPILVSFPIAFFTGTFLFDMLWLIYDNNNFRLTANYLIIAGIAGGLLAAIPGIIDYIYTVPPESSAKKRASKHGLINTTMIIIFAIALWYRQKEDANASIIIALEAVGLVLIFIAGWLGGTLVYRNEIGVDRRYAHAGKWNEARLKNAQGEIEVAATNELKIDQMKLIHINDKRIIIAKTETGFVAFDDRCTHKGGSLAGGSMICGTVQCPWHGSQFDVNTGKVKAGPAKESIKTYTVSERDGKVYLEL